MGERKLLIVNDKGRPRDSGEGRAERPVGDASASLSSIAITLALEWPDRESGASTVSSFPSKLLRMRVWNFVFDVTVSTSLSSTATTCAIITRQHQNFSHAFKIPLAAWGNRLWNGCAAYLVLH